MCALSTPSTSCRGYRALEDTVTLDPIPETWTRALAVVAHPDDLEYGAASAIARWTASGRSIGYVIVTDGEAGIDAIPPSEAAVLRQKEQLASAKIVGVDDVSFLHYRDGVVEYGVALRRDIARHIRRFRPDVLLTASPELTVGMGRGFDPDQFLRAVTTGAGRGLGVEHAIALGRIQLQGVQMQHTHHPAICSSEAYTDPYEVCGARSPPERGRTAITAVAATMTSAPSHCRGSSRSPTR